MAILDALRRVAGDVQLTRWGWVRAARTIRHRAVPFMSVLNGLWSGPGSQETSLSILSRGVCTALQDAVSYCQPRIHPGLTCWP